jgi:phosphoglycolate phosphatase
VPLADVIASYRTYYGAGAMYDTEVYAGVRDLLDSLRACGLRLAVATSKPEHYAVPIVEGLGLAEYFDTIGGDELDGSLGTKALVIGKVLSRLGRPDNVVMIGDRQHDVEGARVHGIPCVGAGWGYGQPGELEAAGAITVCPDPVAALPFLTARAG